MTNRLGVRALGLLVAAGVYGCGAFVGVDDSKPAGGGANAPGFGSDGNGGAQGSSGGSAHPQTRQEFCASTGGGIVLPGTNGCAGDLAKKLFRFGVCSCDSVVANGPIRTRSFDSSTGQTLATGGSIGTNGLLSANGNASIGGSVWAHAAASFNGDAHVFQEMHAELGASANGAMTIDGDYYGTVPPRALDDAKIGGASHVPATVPPPCDCTQQVPIGAIVKAFESSNDDAASGISPTALSGGNAAVDLTLECGRYYFTEITPNGHVTLRLKGRTAIFVGGDVAANGALDVVFDGGAELDLFVTGGVRLNGDATFGLPEAPARVRVYMQGASFSANGQARFAGNLYAPNARVDINGDHTTRGAIYAKALGQNGGLDLEYDEAVLKVQGCEAPGGGCGSCRDCAGATPACKGGTCVACQTNADCCAPLQCQGGSCVPAIK